MRNKFLKTSVWGKMMGIVCLMSMMAGWGCSSATASADRYSERNDSLRSIIRGIADAAPGKVGVAVITPEGDTVTVNNGTRYQLMSVFKLHEALAVGHALDLKGTSVDTIISFPRSEMDPTTWSPMLKEHPEAQISLTVAELLRYILQVSDNNASNLLFDRIVSVTDCDSFIRKATGIEDFSIKYTERQMHRDNTLADGNNSTPLACAILMDKLFTDSIISPEKQKAIQGIVLDCQTGLDRIYVPLKDKTGVTLAHKTGSGFRNEQGQLMAHNDIGRITLPDGRTYSLAVMIKDFNGTEAAASAVMAQISAAVLTAFTKE